MKKSNILTYIIYFAVVAVIMVCIFAMFNQKNEAKPLTYDDMVAKFKEFYVVEVDSNGDGVINSLDVPQKVRRVYGYIRNINKYTVTIFETKEDWDNYFDGNSRNNNGLEAKIKTISLTYEEYIEFFGTNVGVGNSLLYTIKDELEAQGVDST